MIIIERKVTLIAAPEPPFVGTSVWIKTSAESPVWGLRDLVKADDSEAITVDWGDGTVERFEGDVVRVTHEYETHGLHEVRISDDVKLLMLVGLLRVYIEEYAPKIIRVKTNGTKLSFLGSYVAYKAANLTSFVCDAPGPLRMEMMGFKGCAALESISLPTVNSVAAGSASELPFVDCVALREIHFAAANKDALLASSAFQLDPVHLGSPNGTVMFDL